MGELDFQISSIFFRAGEALPAWLVVFLAVYLIWVLRALTVITIKIKSRKFFCELFKIFIFLIIVYAIDFILESVVSRPRPYISHDITPLISTDYIGKSFPSTHSFDAFALSSYLYFKYKKSAYWFFALAFLISIGRVLAGVHYIGDIVAGALIGILCSWLFLKFKFFQKHD